MFASSTATLYLGTFAGTNPPCLSCSIPNKFVRIRTANFSQARASKPSFRALHDRAIRGDWASDKAQKVIAVSTFGYQLSNFRYEQAFFWDERRNSQLFYFMYTSPRRNSRWTQPTSFIVFISGFSSPSII